ncbi:MAG TPA: hypothetical protein VLW83_00315 [Candidatus Acidoferrales bacterium]|nr:hypothetical protein [Candidatus Acidoferrales bacterium]
MRALWRGIVRTVFWSYERGSWPYDVLVGVILVFVLLTPRSWFHDRPQELGTSGTSVQLIAEDSEAGTRTFRLDAAVLSREKRTAKPTPELERETHAILSRTVDDLRDSTFQVVRIAPALASDGSVSYYDVTVRH